MSPFTFRNRNSNHLIYVKYHLQATCQYKVILATLAGYTCDHITTVDSGRRK